MHRSRGGLQPALLVAVAGLALLIGVWTGPIGVAVLLVLAVALCGYAWSVADRTALRALQAYPVGEAQQPVMFRLVRELSTAARQPMPALYVSPTPAPNAFGAGRDRRHAAICCTEGLLTRLDERELRAVLGHEIAHVARPDRGATLTTTLAGGLLHPAQLVWRPSEGSDHDGGGLLAGLLVAVLAPIAAGLLRTGVRRSREYDADAAGAALTGDPVGLALALRSLDAGSRELPLRPEPRLYAASALMIVGPFRPGFLTRLLDTHPPTAERVARLEALAGYRR